MELGQRLKQARLEAGLSQRQLCGEEITRNMLSLIENGSARPSMETLRYLASRLGKPMGYFLEEQAVTSPNQEIMVQARAAFAQKQPVAQLLSQYQVNDPVFDPEYHLLYALSCMAEAEQALADNKPQYAWSLLEQAALHGQQTPYYTPELERAHLTLCYQVRPESAQELIRDNPLPTQQILMYAQGQADPVRKGQILDAFPQDDPQWHLLRAEAWFEAQNFAKAISHYTQAPQTRQVYARLELCHKELGDFQNAYYYALKARE